MGEYSIALMIESNRCDRRFNIRRATKEQINMRVEMKAEGELKIDGDKMKKYLAIERTTYAT